jgi:hypothetical protein
MGHSLLTPTSSASVDLNSAAAPQCRAAAFPLLQRAGRVFGARSAIFARPTRSLGPMPSAGARGVPLSESTIAPRLIMRAATHRAGASQAAQVVARLAILPVLGKPRSAMFD